MSRCARLSCLRLYAALLAFVAATTASAAASAYTPIDVYYVPTGAPAAFSNPFVMERSIQYALREYEQILNGKAIMKWIGTTATPAYGHMTMRIVWEPDLWTGLQQHCAKIEPIAGQGVTIKLNASLLTASGVVVGPTGSGLSCTPMEPLLLHEMAHFYRGWALHFSESVLSDTAIRDYSSMNLWSGDVVDYGLFPGWYGDHHYMPRFERITNTSGATTVGATVDTPLARSANFAVAPGSVAGAEYTLVYANDFTSGKRIWIRQGSLDLSTAPVRLTSVSVPNVPRRKMCAATNVFGTQMLVAYADEDERPETDAFPAARTVRFVTSNDRGATWTSPAALPFALTRTGVTCSFDGTSFAVAYTGLEGAVWLTTRPAAGGSWTIPSTILPAGTTAERPSLSFDPFSTTTGLLTYVQWAGGVLKPVARSIQVSGGTSVGPSFDLLAASPSSPTVRRLRTSPVASQFGTTSIAAYFVDGGTAGDFWSLTRARVVDPLLPSATTTVNSTAFTNSTPLTRYTDSAPNTMFVENALLGYALMP
jgi:hypothetical protein